MKTCVHKRLHIQHSDVQGGMMWVGCAEFAAAGPDVRAFGFLIALSEPIAGQDR